MLEIDTFFVISLLLFFTGFISGILAGFFGIGGGIIVVPVIYHLFNFLDFSQNISMHMAIGTSLATIIPASLNSLLEHKKRDSVDSSLLNKWKLTIFFGSFVGAILAQLIRGEILIVFFAFFSFVVALRMFFTKPYSIKTYNFLKSIQKMISFFIAAISSLLGIGGGTLSVPLLISCGRNIKKAVGTSSGIGFYISLPAALIFLLAGLNIEDRPQYSIGFISIIPFFLITLGTFVSVPMGVKIMHNFNDVLIKRFFCIILLVSAMKMLTDLIL
ncbi:MAG: hypothetical protein CFH28_00899 [Alphaproteobacteria bacterium MarineAlpha6_Bin6]|nr:MAG: hypothetical protein CFH28_00899 [Alphaproteobacteria bacterium MarineAlpha6_Bin6]PPR33955.1 MAG: hypothetical protein CFH27_00251 [Alphaproteobacteria bacterium MarineAlpha6_Bin5]|tara:strand:+ start:6894 stop:7712 length:819 start_codon:yes stop_codon:yes gene_type:complete